jgi:hypothetical protein
MGQICSVLALPKIFAMSSTFNRLGSSGGGDDDLYSN